jgi:hypothetical protein
MVVSSGACPATNTTVPTRYDAQAKSNGRFLSVLVGMSSSNLAFALVSQISNVLRGTIAAKSVVIHVTATNGNPRNKE